MGFNWKRDFQGNLLLYWLPGREEGSMPEPAAHRVRLQLQGQHPLWHQQWYISSEQFRASEKFQESRWDCRQPGSPSGPPTGQQAGLWEERQETGTPERRALSHLCTVSVADLRVLSLPQAFTLPHPSLWQACLYFSQVP